MCGSECITPILRVADCTNTDELARNLTAVNLFCSRHEDGTFFPVTVLGEATRNDGTTTSLLPTCAFGNTCDSSCRQSYLDVRSRLGCCAASWYALVVAHCQLSGLISPLAMSRSPTRAPGVSVERLPYASMFF